MLLFRKPLSRCTQVVVRFATCEREPLVSLGCKKHSRRSTHYRLLDLHILEVTTGRESTTILQQFMPRQRCWILNYHGCTATPRTCKDSNRQMLRYCCGRLLQKRYRNGFIQKQGCAVWVGFTPCNPLVQFPLAAAIASSHVGSEVCCRQAGLIAGSVHLPQPAHFPVPPRAPTPRHLLEVLLHDGNQ